jgi:uncharacterized membrane protein YgcG
MKKFILRRPIWFTICVLLLLSGLAGHTPALAQEKTLYWERYDVNIAVQTDSDMLIEEIQEIAFTSGTFTFGFAAIPLDRVEQITDISVSELTPDGERAYTPNSTASYGFTTQEFEGNLEINWYFPAVSNTTRTYILRYRVIGGVRIYEGGDQVWWKAIPPDHNFSIRSATVTVMPPETFPKEQLTVDSYGAPVSNIAYTDRGAVVFTARDIPPDQELEVRVQFPHGVIEAEPPAWQAAFDRRQTWGPIMTVIFGGLGLILLIGGPVLVYILWYTRGRDVQTPLVAEYISEPPSDLPAGVVGTLVDEQADMKDIIASLLDLAERGAIRIEEQEEASTWGFGVSRDHIFHLVDAGQAIYPHEKKLIERVFGSRDERRLRDLRQKFYTAIPELKKQLYQELVKRGFFASSPESTRQRWVVLSILGIIVAVLLSCGLLALFGDFTGAVICPGVGLIVSMIFLLVFSRHMPRKTPQGAEEMAKWLAFKRYLENIESYSDLEAVKEKFEQYLPYAVAFGLENRLIHQFSAVDTPAPSWWGPVIIPHHGPVYRGGMGHASAGEQGGPPGPLAGEQGGIPSLSEMSSGLGTSLAGMSAGLGSLLNSAGSTFASTPPSSSSGGGFSGGSFSGGGFSGGGGGGGGSRGFG